MAEELFTEEEVKPKADNQLLNNPRYMTRVIMPDGTTGKAAPQDLDALVLSGARTFNPDMPVEVKLDPFSSDTLTVKGSDLQDYLREGYTTQRAAQYNREEQQLQQYQRTELDNLELSGIEKGLGAASALASGASFGATDILARGIYEAGDLLTGEDTADQKSKDLLALRKELGWIGTATEALGAVGTGVATGGLSVLGKGALSRIGLSATEGALGGLGMTAGLQALGDESINADAYFMNVGLGAVVGGLGGGLVEGLGKAASKLKTKPVEVMDVSFGDLTKMKEATTLTQTIPIMSGDTLLGTVNISKGATGYHPGTHGTGVTLEGVQIASSAPKDTLMNTMRQLADEFGMVSSPSTVEAMNPLKADFSKLGLKKTTQMGDDWYVVTPSTMPAAVKESQALLKLNKFMQADGATPAEKELVAKLYAPENSGVRKAFTEYVDDPTVAITNVRKNLVALEEHTNTAKRLADKVREEVGSKITPDGSIAMKVELLKKQRTLIEAGQALEKIKLPDEQGAANILKKIYNTMDTVVEQENPNDAWRQLLRLKRGAGKEITKFIKDKRPGTDVADALNAAYSGMKEVLESGDIIGKDMAELLTDLERRAARSIETSNNFRSEFYTKDANKKWVINNDKIKKALSATLDQDKKLTIVDSLSSDYSAFYDGITNAKKAGLLGDVEIPSLKEILPSLSEINKYREFASLRNILSKKAASNGSTYSTRTLMEVGGSMVGGVYGYIGARALHAIGSLVNKSSGPAVGSPAAGIRMAQKATQSIDKMVELASSVITSVGKPATSIARVALIKELGARKVESSDHDGYVNSVRERLTDLSKPESLNQIQGSIAHPEQEKALIASAGKALKYAIDQLPKQNTYSKTTGIAAKKVDKLVLAVLNPIGALEKAIYEGDTDTIQHVQAMYPKVFEIFQAAVTRQLEDMPKISYQKRAHIQKLTGIVYKGTSSAAYDIAQSVFKAQAEEAPKPKGKSNFTPPTMTAGTAIQDS